MHQWFGVQLDQKILDGLYWNPRQRRKKEKAIRIFGDFLYCALCTSSLWTEIENLKWKVFGIEILLQNTSKSVEERWECPTGSDESEPSWLEPGLELNNFQLGSARLVTFSIQLGNFSIKARKLA